MQLSILLYVYYGFLIIWAFFFLAVIYHMFKFGIKSFTTFITTFIFIAVALLMLYSSYLYIRPIDWSSPIPIISVFFNQTEEIEFE